MLLSTRPPRQSGEGKMLLAAMAISLYTYTVGGGQRSKMPSETTLPQPKDSLAL